jgi:hypothetical protein
MKGEKKAKKKKKKKNDTLFQYFARQNSNDTRMGGQIHKLQNDKYTNLTPPVQTGG